MTHALELFWFAAAAGLLGVYAVLDGFDIGAGAVHFLVARTPDERRVVLKSIGPVWDGNEVWLLAAGGTIFLAFPKLLATAFSGFYLPLIVVLWLFMFRALAVEFRSHVADAVWRSFWDAAFAAASLLLAVFLGAALGNVVRGVPIGADGTFFEPLWTDFRVGADTGILDWYTILVGVAALAILSLHGTAWLALRTAGDLERRALAVARRIFPVVVLLVLGVDAATAFVQPQVAANLDAMPWGWIFVLVPLGALLVMGKSLYPGASGAATPAGERRFFAASSALIFSMVAAAAFGVHPYLLPARDPALSLTIAKGASSSYGLSNGLLWWLPGMALAVGYTVLAYRRLGPKLEVETSRDKHSTH